MPIAIRILRTGDEAVLGNVASGLFDNPIDPKLAAEFLGDHRHHIAVAIHDGLVVGFASALHYVHPDKAPQLWVNEIAVARQYRRQGLAKAVLRALFEVGRAQRCTVAWVLTDRTNVAAMALYSSVGGLEGADEEGPCDGTLGYRFVLG
jgi:aminoglycoside 6'-N-acetyltransferase I